MVNDVQKIRFIIVDLFSGRYVKEHSVGHEKYNLKPNEIDGLYYGYCPPYGGIGIERLGANRSAMCVDNVMLIYTHKIGMGANREVIAFTDKATVFRKEQSGKGMQRQIVVNGKTLDCGYHFVSENLYIIEDEEDRFKINCSEYNSYMFRKQRVFAGRYGALDEKLLKWINEYLVRMSQDDSLFQNQLEGSSSTGGTDTSASREPEFLDSSTGRVVKKNPAISKRAVATFGFKCAYNANHQTFLRKSGQPYMEGHHLIPCTSSNAERFWKRFGKSIDCVANIVSLCPTCHRRIHFGSEEERVVIIEKLYEVQAEKLKAAGLLISQEELKKMYRKDDELGVTGYGIKQSQ